MSTTWALTAHVRVGVCYEFGRRLSGIRGSDNRGLTAGCGEIRSIQPKAPPTTLYNLYIRNLSASLRGKLQCCKAI